MPSQPLTIISGSERGETETVRQRETERHRETHRETMREREADRQKETTVAWLRNILKL